MSSLFDNISTWQREPLLAFQSFVISPEFQLLGKRTKANDAIVQPTQMRASSAKIYTLMFGKFLRWLDERELSLLTATNTEILAFLEHGSAPTEFQSEKIQKKDLNSSIRIRYLRMFERVYQHLQIHPNPARHAAFDIYKSSNKALRGNDLDKVAMSGDEQNAFMAALPPAPPTPVVVQPASVANPENLRGWKRRRDRAMQAMMLGAGLKVSEVIGIITESIGAIDATGCIPVTISPGSTAGTSRWHQTQLRQFAVHEVNAWKRERIALGVPGPLLFPASLQGGILDKATVYRQVKATFERAAITVDRSGGRTLRNTFAVRELQQGAPVELVGEFMGHRKRKSTEHYILKTPPKPSRAKTRTT